MFQLNKGELENWRSQIVMSNPAAKMGAPQAAIRLHRAWRGHALFSSQERAGCPHEHCDYVGLRQAP